MNPSSEHIQNNSDKDLMKLIASKNTIAFKELYKRYYLSIFNFILRYTGNQELAQDLLQETFIRIWNSANTYNATRGNFKGWIFKIALNMTKNEMSKKRYQYHYFELSELYSGLPELTHSENEQPDKKLETSELKQEIDEVLGKLQPYLREVVLLKHFHQLKFREIAQITDTPEGTLKARFHRAIAELRVLLKNSMEI